MPDPPVSSPPASPDGTPLPEPQSPNPSEPPSPSNPDQEEASEDPSEPKNSPQPETWPSHWTITGLPRTGKTTLAAEIFKTLSQRKEAALFFNVQGEDYFPGVKHIPNIAGHEAAICSGESFVVDCNPWDVTTQLISLYWVQRGQAMLNPITCFVDEAHLIAARGTFQFPEDGVIKQDNIVGVLCTTGLRFNIRLIWITQRPQFCDAGIYRTARIHVFFTLDPSDIVWLRQAAGIQVVNPEWHDYVVVKT